MLIAVIAPELLENPIVISLVGIAGSVIAILILYRVMENVPSKSTGEIYDKIDEMGEKEVEEEF